MVQAPSETESVKFVCSGFGGKADVVNIIIGGGFGGGFLYHKEI